MEGLLCRWALALQEYDFKIEYKKGSTNSNADALSRRPGQEAPDKMAAAVRTQSDVTDRQLFVWHRTGLTSKGSVDRFEKAT